MSQNITGTVFFPRLYHLMAYVCLLMGDGQNCDLFLDTALQLCEAQGNLLDMHWLNMSRVSARRPSAAGPGPGLGRLLGRGSHCGPRDSSQEGGGVPSSGMRTPSSS